MPIFTCTGCNKEFERKTKDTYSNRSRNDGVIKTIFCSNSCRAVYRTKKQEVKCKNCGSNFMKSSHEIRRSPSHFCSRRCSVIHNNKNKTVGTQVSKLEKYLHLKLTELYSFDFHFNRKDTIQSELDIYIPELKLAFELNGIFHYEPIFGKDKLEQTQNNDNRKFQACIENGIELCIIDTSGQRYFKESTSQKYLQIIIDVIEKAKRARIELA